MFEVKYHDYVEFHKKVCEVYGLDLLLIDQRDDNGKAWEDHYYLLLEYYRPNFIDLPIEEVEFTFFDNIGNETKFGKHQPWLFEVKHPKINPKLVVKVKLPDLDYHCENYENNHVRIYFMNFPTEDHKNDFLSFYEKKENV